MVCLQAWKSQGLLFMSLAAQICNRSLCFNSDNSSLFSFSYFSSFYLGEGIGGNHVRFEVRETRKILIVKNY